MYPQPELTRLAVYKAALRQDIAFRRSECAAAAARLAQPFEWLDRMLAFWRRLSPLAQFAAIPLGFAVKRALFPRAGLLGSLLRWSPLVFGAARAIGSAVKARSRPAHASNGRR
ncbi:MAG TPA: hypothetical protein VK717_00905 [Opitutaceae bacterium]|jgi:hypothetical protein|nr:hypothetical protein [Opitutaceae bacterium]